MEVVRLGRRELVAPGRGQGPLMGCDAVDGEECVSFSTESTIAKGCALGTTDLKMARSTDDNREARLGHDWTDDAEMYVSGTTRLMLGERHISGTIGLMMAERHVSDTIDMKMTESIENIRRYVLRGQQARISTMAGVRARVCALARGVLCPWFWRRVVMVV
ncbi:hypothetical protein BHE74_00028473 [Ensete ventricosum]|nr:hypothetical protein BHE74_00028473 [Ensete ventricosum]